MSESYQSFAYVYDIFMDDIPYEEWSEYLIHLFNIHGINSGNLVELGCGTASLSILMANAGFNITAIDNSVDMLTVAADKIQNANNIQLVNQDMTKLELSDIYDGVYSLCDSINYLLTSDELYDTFSGVNEHLKTNGIFIFDLKTEYFYNNVLGDQVFCDHRDDCSYTWENNYFEDDHINQYDMHFFIKHADSGLYEHFNEVHHQRAYDIQEIISLMKASGLQYITAYDAFTNKRPTPVSERIYIIAGKGDSNNE